VLLKVFSDQKYPFRDSRRNFLFFSEKLTRIWDKIGVSFSESRVRIKLMDNKRNVHNHTYPGCMNKKNLNQRLFLKEDSIVKINFFPSCSTPVPRHYHHSSSIRHRAAAA
jgi:hypothetical protein